MNITASQVNELRQMTGAGMMDCKKALVETDGDIQAAIDILRKKGMAKAAKRADRTASEGCVLSKATEDHKYAAIIMVNCELRDRLRRQQRRLREVHEGRARHGRCQPREGYRSPEGHDARRPDR